MFKVIDRRFKNGALRSVKTIDTYPDLESAKKCARKAVEWKMASTVIEIHNLESGEIISKPF